MQCMDMNGKLLWAEDLPAKAHTARGGLEDVKRKIHTHLDARLGMPGLPVADKHGLTAQQ